METIFRALNDAQAEYLVVGGVAVMAHGHVRYTHDLDLVLGLTSARLPNALGALMDLGFRSRLALDVLDFCDPENRARWRTEKGMVVFNLFSDQIPDVSIDIFPYEPFDFSAELANAKIYSLSPKVMIPVVSLAQLIHMKREAGRPQDLIDVDKLSKVHRISSEKE